MNWRDYHPKDPEGLRPFVAYLIEETFTKPIKQEYIMGKTPEETYDEAYARVMKELKEYIKSFNEIKLRGEECIVEEDQQ